MIRKSLFLALFIGLGSFLFGQTGSGLSLGLGFQYGTARIFDKGDTLREISEPGLLVNFRFIPGSLGLFARLGMLFPSQVTEGGLELSHDEYDYILFLNGAAGPAFSVSLNDRFSFIFDLGLSINDLLYGGSYKSDIDTTWKIKFSNMGQTYIQKGGRVFTDVKMKEIYNDIAFGLMGNAAVRFNFTRNVYMELGVAASFDFLRLRSYKFAADFSGQGADWADDFPNGKVEDDELILESDSNIGVFKQFTVIPSISVGFSF
ncbi:MAG: hypothetical protein LBE02_03580 [Spirochaetaceae bacterium]|jgi:hypothetical protein|nr:hypothetical protein [Spirochaetaceae bacterium]